MHSLWICYVNPQGYLYPLPKESNWASKPPTMNSACKIFKDSYYKDISPMQFVFQLGPREQGKYSSGLLIKNKLLTYKMCLLHSSTWRRDEDKKWAEKRAGFRNWDGRLHNAPRWCVINHPFSIKLDFPWKHIMECAEGCLDKRGIVKRCEKPNSKSTAGCQDIFSSQKVRRLWTQIMPWAAGLDLWVCVFSVCVCRNINKCVFPEENILKSLSQWARWHLVMIFWLCA